MPPRKKMTVQTSDAEEAPMSTTPSEAVGLTAEMTDAEAIETLVRTDEEHLTDDLPPFTPGLIADEVPQQVKDGQTVAPTQGKIGMFHVLSQIGDGVFVAWDRCHNAKERHSIAECKCKGGPVEPKYVTEWREEYFQGKAKAAAKEADARRKKDEKALAATVSDGIEAATEAVQAAATEEVPDDQS